MRADEEITGESEEPETARTLSRAPLPMLVSVVLLTVGGLAVGVVPAFAAATGRAAGTFVDGAGYLAQALHGATGGSGADLPEVVWTRAGVLLGLLSFGGAVLVSVLALVDLPDVVGRQLRRLRAPLHLLHRLHSGHVGDYIAWLMFGLMTLGVLIAVPTLA
ncbi:MAG: hypothetical protein WCA46_00985 [Actinocatenispora sp.]